MNRGIGILLVALLCNFVLSAQCVDIDSISCINLDADTITFNGADWSPLFDSLTNLQDSTVDERRVVSIVHLGDSHVQAGFFSEALRLSLQAQWGNAGRGFIAPLRISKSNEPADYKITSPDKWTYHRCINGKNFSPLVGVSGISITPATDEIDITIETMSRYGEEIGFNTLRLYHSPSDMFPQLMPADTPHGFNYYSLRQGETYFTWSDTTHIIHLQGGNSYANEHATIYGASLENSHNGILLHSIGNNSATYECYNRIDDYGRKLSMLEPHLVIISMGTNESVSNLITHEAMYDAIHTLVSDIRNHSPHTLILLTTPADNKIRNRKKGKRSRQYTPNTRVAIVTDAIKNYGERHNIAVWDWHAISGGEGSCDTWVKENGMRKDYIHYTAQGYALQGTLLYQSILKAYVQYIR